jgi:hypothetical protein
MFIIELRDSGVVNVTRDNVSLETSQRKSRLRSKPRTYMDSFDATNGRIASAAGITDFVASKTQYFLVTPKSASQRGRSA